MFKSLKRIVAISLCASMIVGSTALVYANNFGIEVVNPPVNVGDDFIFEETLGEKPAPLGDGTTSTPVIPDIGAGNNSSNNGASGGSDASGGSGNGSTLPEDYVGTGVYDPGFNPEDGISLKDSGLQVGGSGSVRDIKEGKEGDLQANRGNSDIAIEKVIENQHIVDLMSEIGGAAVYLAGVGLLIYSLLLWAAYILPRAFTLIPKKYFNILTFGQYDLYEMSIPNFLIRQFIITAVSVFFITGIFYTFATRLIAKLALLVGIV